MQTRATRYTIPRPAKQARNGEANRLQSADVSAHAWYRFVLSYPPHLVRDYVDRFGLTAESRVLDPFCGTGTTLVECKKLGIPSVGVERHPMAHFATTVKTDWSVDPDGLMADAERVAEATVAQLAADGIGEALPLFLREVAANMQPLRTLDPEQTRLLLTNSISPLPLHRCLTWLEEQAEHGATAFRRHEQLAFAKAVVFAVSNLSFGPEVGVGTIKPDAPLVGPWLSGMSAMRDDLLALHDRAHVEAVTHLADARQVADLLPPASIDAVITSPPYPNEKDYTRTTRLESVLLGFVRTKADLQVLKKGLVRSNTRSVYKQDDDDLWVADHPEIQRIANAIEARRLELGKTSGFERMYARLTRLYFGGMARHLAELRRVLRPGAQLAYVVGDQASYLRVMIRTGQLLADIAQSQGYEVTSIDLFRTRLSTATREQLREEVVVLRWPG